MESWSRVREVIPLPGPGSTLQHSALAFAPEPLRGPAPRRAPDLFANPNPFPAYLPGGFDTVEEAVGAEEELAVAGGGSAVERAGVRQQVLLELLELRGGG